MLKGSYYIFSFCIITYLVNERSNDGKRLDVKDTSDDLKEVQVKLIKSMLLELFSTNFFIQLVSRALGHNFNEIEVLFSVNLVIINYTTSNFTSQ